MLGQARRKLTAAGGVALLRASALALPLSDGNADLVFMSMAYHHFADPGLANHRVAYWGTNLKRLVDVKLQYDPKLVFTPPQDQEIMR